MTAREFLKTLPMKLGLGCMRFPMLEGSTEATQVDVDEAVKMIRHSIDSGAVYIDTAYPYHGGVSESIVAKALKEGYRDKAVIADKLPSWLVKAPEDLDHYLNEQLGRLEVSCIDFYLLHALNVSHWNNYDKVALVDFIKRAKADCRIKYIGFSFHDDLPLFKEIVDFYPWDFVQIQYNYMDISYQAGLEGLTYASDKDMAIIVMEPLRGGSLSGNLAPDVEEKIQNMMPGITNTGFAFEYLKADNRIDMVLSGMSNMDQLNENLKTFSHQDIFADEALLKGYEEVRKRLNDKIKVGCTACNYCMPCPHGVQIPRVFSLYNAGFMYNNQASQQATYHRFVPQEAKAHQCVACGECQPKCPQNIAIISALQEVAQSFGEE